MAQDKRDQLYDNLIGSGKVTENEIGNREEFKAAIKDENSSRQFYKNILGSGLLSEDELGGEDQFYNSISSDFAPAKPAGYKPSAEDMAGFQSTIRSGQRTLDAIPSIQQGINKAEKRAKQRAGLNVPQRIKVGETNNLRTEQHINPKTGELEDTYITEGLHEYDNKAMAEQEQQMYNERTRAIQWRKDHPQEALLQDIDSQTQKLDSMLGKQEIDWIDQDGRIHYKGGRGGDEAVETIKQAKQDLEEARTRIERSQQLQASSDFLGGIGIPFTKDWYNNWKNFGYGIWDTLHDPSLYDFGLSDLQKAGMYLKIKNKIEKGEELTDQETALALAGMAGAQAQQIATLPHGYTAGVTTMEMAPFMLQMAVNPASGTGRALARQAVRKFGRDGIKAVSARMGARVLGNIAEGAVLSNTLQAGSTAANIMQRYTGDTFQYSDDGKRIVLGHYEEGPDGEPMFVEGGKGLARSAWEGEASSIIENVTELGTGGNINKFLGKMATSKAGRAIGLGYINDLVAKIGATPFARNMKKFMERTHWDGMIEEPLEEEYGIILNSLLTGDNKISDLWDSEQQADIFAGTMWFGGFMAGMNTAAYPIYKRRIRREVNRADIAGQQAFGDEWEVMKAGVEEMDDKQLVQYLYDIKDNDSFNNAQKAALFAYASRLKQQQGANTADMLMRMEGNLTKEQTDIRNSYDRGIEMTEPQDMNEAKMQLDIQNQRLSEMFKDYKLILEEFENNPMGALNGFINNDHWSPEEKQAAIDYVNARTTYEGMLDGVRDDIEGKIEISNATIDKRSNPNDGMVHPATLKDDKQVYIIGGNVVMDETGTNVDVEASKQATGGDNMILTVNAETGKVEAHDINEFMTVEQPMDANRMKAEAAENIRQVTAQQAADKIDGKLAFQPNDQYQILDEQGGEHAVQIVQDNGDGTVMATIDGAAEPIPMAMQDVQTMADAYNQAKVMQQQAELQAERGAESASLAENDSEGAAEQQVEEPEQTVSAMDKIPVVSNEKGEPIFNKRGEKTYLWHQAPVTDSADALSEMTEGDLVMARDTAKSMIENTKQDLEKANKLKPQGRDPQSIINSRKNIAATQQQARDVVKYWQDVQDELNRRMTQATIDRKAAEEAAKTEEQRAAEAQRAAELAAKQAEIDAQRRAEAIERERKERNKPYAPLQRAKKDMAGYPEAEDILNDTEPRDLPEWVSHLLRPHSLLWEDEKVGESTLTGLQSELGLQKKDFERIGTLLGKRKDGAMPFAQVVDEIHEGLPEGMKEQYTDQDVRNALIDLFSEGSVNRMLHLAEEHRIEEAQQTVAELEKRYAEAELEAWAEAYHLTPEERESFEEFMQEAPSEPEQEIINQIIGEYEQNRPSEGMDSQPDNGADAGSVEGGEGQVQQAVEAAGNGVTEQTVNASAEAAAGEQTVTDNTVFGERKVETERQKQLRADLTNAYASGNVNDIQQAVDAIQAYLEEGGDFDGAYSEEIDDYEGTEPDMLAEQYITHAMLDRYLDDDEDQEYIRTGLRKDLRETKEQTPIQEPINQATLTEQEIADEISNVLDDMDDGIYSNLEVFGITRDMMDMLPDGEAKEILSRAFDAWDAQQRMTDKGPVVSSEESDKLIRAIRQAIALIKQTNETQMQSQQLGETSSPEEIAAEEAKVNTEPTEGQKKAGNYQMGHIKVDGFDVSIENPKGSTRSGVDQNGKAWSQEMHNTYGYIRGTEGVDGDHIDVFLSDYPDEGYIYVIDQVNPETGEFDEHKVMYGFESVEDATEAYLSNYEEGWKGLGNINRVERSEFKKWVDSSHRKTKPFAEYKSVKKDEFAETGEGVKTVDTLDIPADVKDLMAELERVHQEYYDLLGTDDNEEYKKKTEKLNKQISESSRKLDAALRTLTTKQLLEVKDAYKGNGGVIYRHATEEIHNRQIAQQQADIYDKGAKEQSKVEGKSTGKPAKAEEYTEQNNPNRQILSGMYHDPDGYGVVSDGFVLLADKKAYDKAHKGEILSVGKDAGKKVDGEYPNWKRLVDSNTEGFQKAKINVSKLLDFIAGVEEQLKAQWKAEKDAKRTKMSFKDWADYAEIFLKMPDGSVISFRPQRLKLFAQGMQQIGANEIEYLNIYNKVFARNKNGVALVMPLANYDTWSVDGDVHRYFYDLSEGKAPTKQSWNTNVAENYSNISNGTSQSQDNDVTLPSGWQELPTNDVYNERTGQQIKGLKTLLKENYTKLLKAYGKWSDRGSIVVLTREREAIQRELDQRSRKYKEWRDKYNIDEQGRISLEDLSRLFSDLNSNKRFAKLFEKVAQVAKQIGLDIRFDADMQSAGSSNYTGGIKYLTGYLTSSGLDNQYVAGILLHELIHSVTQSTVSAYKAGGEKAAALTESQKKAAKKIIDIYNELKEYADKNGLDDYGFRTPHEMIAEISKYSFRHTLRSIKLKEKKSLWEVLKDALHGIFGLTKERNMVSEVEKALDDLLDNFSMQTFDSMRDYQGDNWSTLKEVEKTLMGVHNIPEYKLRKVLKQGGLANPSLAVVDTKNHIHTDYGEISLIPRSSMIDARKGRNAGTFTADAWTATYPQVMKKMTNKGWDMFYKDTRDMEKYEDGGEEMASKIRMAWDSYLDGRDPSELYWWYLLDRGLKPEAVRYQNEYGADLTSEVTHLATDENGSDLEVSQLSDEAIKRIAELKRNYEIQQDEEKKPVEERIAAARASMEGKNDIFRANRQRMIDELEKYGDTLGNIKSWVSKVVWAGRREGLLDVYGTTREAQKEVKKNHASDFQAWLLEKEGKYGVEEKLFAGTDDYTGRQKWVANTLANASRLMKKQGLNGAIAWSNLGEWIAKVAKRVTTLAEIRKERKNLNTTQEQHDAFHEKWGKILHELSMKIAADGDMWSGEARLTEALEHNNPADYIQREYGINLSKKDRASIDKFIKEVRENFPTGYFETKFQRPVYLNEFAVAVVPDTTSPDIIAALEREGLKVSTYHMDNVGNPNDESRRQAVMKAAQDEDDILFRDDEEDEAEHDIFYSNAMYAVNNIAQEKATPDQWIAMIQKQGGLKAGEDKWLGLSDWLNDQKKAGVKSLTKQQLIDFINENQIQVEETRYSGNIDVDNIPKMIEFRKEFNDLKDKYEKERNAVVDETERFNQAMYDKYGYGWANQLSEEDKERWDDITERYEKLNDSEIEELAFRDMIDNYGDDFDMAFEVNYGNGRLEPTVDMYGDGMSDAAKHYLEMDEQPIDDTRLQYTTGGLDNNREIALTVPTIEPYNESDYVHFGDAGEGRAVAWVRFGDATAPIKEDVVKHADEFEAPYDNGRGMTLYYPKDTKPGWSKDYIVHGKDKDGKDFYRVVIAEATIGVYDIFEEAQKNMNLYFHNHPKQQITGHEKVLVIDEIQSKRHQEGREKGYSEAADIAKKHGWNIIDDRYDPKVFNSNGDRLTRNPDLVGKKDGEHTFVLATDEEWQDILKYFEEKRRGIPAAPFEKNWHELAMKRMLRYAAENGYDKIAWTTGAQQAKRYSLSNVVESIDVGNWGEDVNGGKLEIEQGYKGKSSWTPENDVEKAIKDYIEYCMENGDTFSMAVAYANNQITDAPDESKGWTYDEVLKVADAIEEDLTGYKDARGVVINVGDDLIGITVNRDGKILDSSTTDFVGKSLADVVGKEVALKIVGKEGKGRVDAGDLAIGGEGMKGFYDDMLPRFMNKYGKKWGVKVGTVHLPELEQGYDDMWSIDVTPEMKADVMEGQPLFRLDDLEMTPRTTGEDMPWEDEEDNPIFFSNAKKAIETIKQDKATPEQWLAMLQKQGGLKAGEDKWIGLTEWLNDQKEAGVKSLNKQQLLQYIRSNQIRIDETHYGDTMFSPNSMINLESEIQKSLYDGGTVEDALRQWDKEFGDTKLQEYQQGRFTVDEKGRIHTDEELMKPIENTRKSFTTKGLSEKKEIALTVPTIEPYKQTDRIHFGDAGEGRAVAWIRFGETPYWSEESSVTEAREALKVLNDKYDGQLVRNPDMTEEEKKQVKDLNKTLLRGKQGYKRALVIDEIQSKRHQEGREQGYEGEYKNSPRGQYDEAHDKLVAFNKEMEKKYGEYFVQDDMTEEELATYNKLYDDTIKKSVVIDDKTYHVPDAPFEKNWHELAMKRMLRYAAEHGFDKIAWTTGQQQADRYNLSKVIRSIRNSSSVMSAPNWYTLVPQGGAQFRIHVGENGKIDKVNTSGYGTLLDHTLTELFGKEAAPKIEALKDNEAIDFENQTIGGEGMKGFYDDMLPRFLNKYGKKWGVKVEKTTFPRLGYGGKTMWSIEVTPEMRESVLKGQPMFRLRDQEPPKKTGIGYKVFVVKDGKLYPPMVANPNGEATPVGEWLDADAAPIAGTSKTGRPQVKAGGKGTQGGSGTLAYRPGWHLGTIPYASQFNRKDANGDKTLFPKDFVWAEVEYADDVDYSEEARQEGMNANGKYQHSLAGLKRVPENGSYRYRTNPDPKTDEWIITGAMKVNRLLTPTEVDQMVRNAGREPQQRQEGALTDEQVEALNNELDVNNKLTRQTQEQEPQQKVETKRTPAQQRARAAFAERQRRRAVDLAKETVEKLNLQDKVTILDNADGLTGRYKKAKGWYDRATGKIVIVIDNHKSPSDVMMTILHEGVAHYGLRKLFGKNFDQFLKNVYEHSAFDIKVEIADMAARLRARDHKYGRTIKSNEQYQMDATEEFLAKLAEDTDFERAMNQSWWQQIKQWFIDMCREVGLPYFDGELTDNELRYILWRSYQNLAEPGRYVNMFQEAEAIWKEQEMKRKLGISNMAEPQQTETTRQAAEPKAKVVNMETPKQKLEALKAEYKKLDDMMKDKQGRDFDQQFDKDKQDYIKKYGFQGVGAFQSEWLKQAIEKYGEENIQRRWNLQEEIDALEDNPELFRDDEDEEDDEDNIMHFNAGRPTLDETIINGLMRLAKENSDNVQLRIDAMKAIGGNLSKLRQAMSKQRAYDKETVNQIVRLARSIMENGSIDKLTRGEVKKLIGLIAGAAGKEDITTAAKKVVDMLVGNQLRQVRDLLQKQLAIRGTKIDSKGVEVQGQLDIEGVRMARALKEGMTLTEDALAERIDDCLDRMGSADDTISQQATAEYQGYILAQQYIDEVRRSESEEANLKYEKKRAREDYDAGRLTKEQYREFVDSVDDTILSNQLERIRGYYDLLANIGDILSRSTKRAKEFRDKEIAHIREIQHNANSDMEGRAYDEHHKPTWMEKAANWPFVRFFMKPLATFDQMLRLFGSKSVNGEGYLWTRFMNGYTEASDKEWRNLYQDYQDLDKKVSEVFGKKMKWSDLFSIERKMPGMKVSFWDGGERKEHTLTPGNLLYIYMANKMADGRMKLRKMGITEDDVNTIKEHLDPRFVELADWLQNEYLPEKRVYFNSVHEDLFGASMAAIDNYFPLVINKRDLTREEEVGSEDYLGDDKIGATITGNIIKRTKNAKALDITNADAFDVILQHLQQMEHWAAYAAMNKDLGALLSYKHFRNQVLNMKSLQYGSGQNLWVNFKRACAVVSGAYRPKIDKDSVDTSLVNLAKGVTAAKISLRVFTALKQLLSYPAYLSEASLIELAKYTNPIGAVVAFNWAIDNLPGFSKRWQSRIAGDTRLQDTDVDWGFWKNKIVKAASKIGMLPNAFVDAMTVAMGAKAIYETKKKQYLADGYSEEQAEKKALNAASISFNETQQSSEQAFLSAMQLDRTVASVALTVFRNSSMGYQRRFTGAIRNLQHMMTPGYRAKSIEFMSKQMQREGLTEQQAERAAKRTYNRSWYKNIADVLIFGFVMQLAWNLGPYLPYLIGGDDDDEKNKMLEDAMMHALAGGVEGLTGGAQMSEIYNIIRSGGDISSYQFNLLPLMSDLQQTLRHFKSDEVAAWNDVINLLIQSGIGVNPQTLTDAFVAIQDAAEGDPETSKEIALLIMRIMQMPQSSIDKVMIDELGLTGEEARKLDAEALARRWATYKRRKSTPLTGWAYRDEEEAEVEKKYVDKFTKKIKERIADKSEEDLQSMMDSESDEFMKEIIQKQLNKMTEATMDEQNIHMIESDFNATHDAQKRKLMARRIAKSTGASKDPYGSKSDKEYEQLYQELRTANDVREDAELLHLQEQAKENGDTSKADEISKERQAVRKTIRGMEPGNPDGNAQAIEQLRAERKQLLEKYGITR